jgi:tRNA G26 N,N-dimethylase Trm1
MENELENTNAILVFKTNIKYKKDVKNITPLMSAETRIKKWNIDREDISKVLRIESDKMHPSEITHIINKAGYSCEELTD